jgi:restriction system protein
MMPDQKLPRGSLRNAGKDGKFGKFGGRFVPAHVMPLTIELEAEYSKIRLYPALQSITDIAELTIQSVVVGDTRTMEGRLIEAVTTPWYEIIDFLKADPSLAFQIPPEKWEEIIARAYSKAGFSEVILTPRSGDNGRDIIATLRGIGTVRVIDQVKAYKPGHLVTANDVRSLYGVLIADGASKGFLTTTSDFAPKLPQDILLAPLIPSRLELINGQQLIARLIELAKER